MLRRFRTPADLQRFRDGPAPRRQELDSQERASCSCIESVEGSYSNRNPGGGHEPLTGTPAPQPDRLTWWSGVRPLDPDGRGQCVAGFRRAARSTLVSLRILLLWCSCRLLFQQSAERFVNSPVVDVWAPDVHSWYTTPNWRRRPVEKLRIYKAEIEFDALAQGDRFCPPELRTSPLSRAAE